MPHESPKKSQEPIAASAMANCVFPEDIMICILTRLPVKSILRFKSVCKPWRELFSTPEFIKMHHGQSSSDPKNQSFIVHRINKNLSNTMFLFNIESNVKKPTNLDHPISSIRTMIDVVGCCNGLFCIKGSQVIVLWNPAMKLSMSVPPSKLNVDFGAPEMVSLGFGYDAEGADFKVVRIVSLEMSITGVEVYSVKSDSWRTIKVDFQFNVLETKSVVIVNGNPYWVAKVDGNESAKSVIGEVLVCFDVTKLVFKIVPLSTLYLDAETEVDLVDWNGSLGALVCTKDDDERVQSLDAWVFDDGQQIWRKNHTFGPIEVNVDRFLQCSKNGKILGVRPDGKLFVFDPKTRCVKFLFYGAQELQSFEIYGYTESLAYIKGMRHVQAMRRKRKMINDASRRS